MINFLPFNMYELFSGNIWHSSMVSARKSGVVGLEYEKGLKMAVFWKFDIVDNCSQAEEFNTSLRYSIQIVNLIFNLYV